MFALLRILVPKGFALKLQPLVGAKSYKKEARNSGIHPDRQVASSPLILNAS